MSKLRRLFQSSDRKHARGTLFLILQPLFLNALSVPVTAYIIRTLGADAYGEWSVALALVAFVTFLTNFGLRMHLVRSLAQHPETAPHAVAEHLGLRILLSLGAGGVAVLACLVLRYPLLVLECTALSALGLLFTVIAGVAADLFQAQQRLSVLACINLFAGLLLTASSIATIRAGWGPLGLAVSYLLGPMAAGIVSLWYINRTDFPVTICMDRTRFGLLLRQSRMLALQMFVGVLGSQAEAMLVPKMVGIIPFGYFSAGSLLTNRLGIVPDALNTAFYPRLAQGYREGTHALAREATRFLVVSLTLCLMVALVITALANPIAVLLFPTRAEFCRAVIQITIWSLPLIAIGNVMGYTLNAVGREADQVRVLLPTNVIGLLISAIMIQQWGLIGACWALILRNTLSLFAFATPFFRVFSRPDAPTVLAEKAV
jgi:O-antigen/teichoic acid export membrane protein